MCAVAKEQWPHNIVRYASNDAADRRDQQALANVSGEREPQRRGHPNQCGADDRYKRKKSHQHSPENCGSDSRKRERQAAECALNGGHEQPHRYAGKNQFLGFVHHVFLDGWVKWQEMAHGAHNVVTITEHKKQREEEHEEIQEKRKDIFYQAAHFGGEESRYLFRSASYGIGEISILHGVRQLVLKPVEHLRG